MSDGSTQVAINGKSVDLSLTVGRVLYGKGNGSDLGELENGPISTMFVDPTVLGKTVWDVYRDRLQQAGIETDSAFYDLLDGLTVRKIESAVKKAITDFFSWGAPVISRLDSKIGNLGNLIEQMEQASGPSSGEPQGSLESTQAT